MRAGKRPTLTDVTGEDALVARPETPSEAYRRGVIDSVADGPRDSGGGGRWGRFGKIIGGVLVVALGSGGVGAGVATKMQPGVEGDLKCSASTVQLVLHQDAAGRDLAAAQEAAGQTDIADRTRRLTDVRNLPEDIQLCVLLAKQRPGVDP